MKLAFCLFKYFPFGGLQRDFMRIAKACHRRGHAIHIFTTSWDTNEATPFNIEIIKAKAWQNHTRSKYFVKELKKKLDLASYDVVIGFNKIPYLDVYYAADVCYKARMKQARHFLYSLLPRYRQWVSFEEAVFARGKNTQILLISPKEKEKFIHHYQTENNRFHLLPPGICKNQLDVNECEAIRSRVRHDYQIQADSFLLLMVGSGFKTKGLDRVLFALASLPLSLKERCQLFVIGKDNPYAFIKQAKRLGVLHHIKFLGGRDDVSSFMLAADVLLHPAYHENTGTVLLEALAFGLPVLTVDVCGYAHYISTSVGGVVLSSPFNQDEFNRALEKMLLSEDRNLFKTNGLTFALSTDLYSLAEKAADFIENVGYKRVSAS